MKVCISEKSPKTLDQPSVRVLVSAFLKFHSKKCDEVSIHFVDTKTICQLHEDYFDDSSTTDCISFPMDNDELDTHYKILGEVFVCPETAIIYAKKHDSDPFKEITLYVVHGLLHLLGFDDISLKDRKVMRMEEARFLEFAETENLWIKPLKFK